MIQVIGRVLRGLVYFFLFILVLGAIEHLTHIPTNLASGMPSETGRTVVASLFGNAEDLVVWLFSATTWVGFFGSTAMVMEGTQPVGNTVNDLLANWRALLAVIGLVLAIVLFHNRGNLKKTWDSLNISRNFAWGLVAALVLLIAAYQYGAVGMTPVILFAGLGVVLWIITDILLNLDAHFLTDLFRKAFWLIYAAVGFLPAAAKTGLAPTTVTSWFTTAPTAMSIASSSTPVLVEMPIISVIAIALVGVFALLFVVAKTGAKK